MNPREEELLGILQEEAAENIEILSRIIKVISKQRRFGKTDYNTKELEHELGDFLGVLDLLSREGYISLENLEPHIRNKIAKLEVNMVNKRKETL